MLCRQSTTVFRHQKLHIYSQHDLSISGSPAKNMARGLGQVPASTGSRAGLTCGEFCLQGWRCSMTRTLCRFHRGPQSESWDHDTLVVRQSIIPSARVVTKIQQNLLWHPRWRFLQFPPHWIYAQSNTNPTKVHGLLCSRNSRKYSKLLPGRVIQGL